MQVTGYTLLGSIALASIYGIVRDWGPVSEHESSAGLTTSLVSIGQETQFHATHTCTKARYFHGRPLRSHSPKNLCTPFTVGLSTQRSEHSQRLVLSIMLIIVSEAIRSSLRTSNCNKNSWGHAPDPPDRCSLHAVYHH